MNTAFAQTSPLAFTDAALPIVYRINEYILNPIIALGFGWAVVVFFWGLFQFIRNTDSDDERETGKRNIFYGILGMFIMVTVYGIINLLLDAFGLGGAKPAVLP
jgi:hypothetical protein